MAQSVYAHSQQEKEEAEDHFKKLEARRKGNIEQTPPPGKRVWAGRQSPTIEAEADKRTKKWEASNMDTAEFDDDSTNVYQKNTGPWGPTILNFSKEAKEACTVVRDKLIHSDQLSKSTASALPMGMLC